MRRVLAQPSRSGIVPEHDGRITEVDEKQTLAVDRGHPVLLVKIVAVARKRSYIGDTSGAVDVEQCDLTAHCRIAVAHGRKAVQSIAPAEQTTVFKSPHTGRKRRRHRRYRDHLGSVQDTTVTSETRQIVSR